MPQEAMGATRTEGMRNRRTEDTAACQYNWRHADRPLQNRTERDPGTDGRRHRQAVPGAVQTARRWTLRIGDDEFGSAFLEHTQVDAPHGPRRRTCAGVR